MNKFLRVVDLLAEEHEIGHLTHKVVADRNLLELGVLLKLGIVHGEVDHLLVIHNGDQLSPLNVRLIVF